MKPVLLIMKNMVVILFVVFIFFVILVIKAFVIDDICVNKQIIDYPSPDGKQKIVVFQRDCGATTGFSTQVSILNIHESLDNKSGNILILSSSSIFVKWKNNDTVLISLNPKSEIFKKDLQYENVKILYSYYKRGFKVKSNFENIK